MSESAVRVAAVYPELLGTYGDTGNALVLRRRLQWRGVPVEVVEVGLDDPLPSACDLYLLGGGEDEAQLLALEGLRRGGLVSAVERGAHVFGVCAALQVLGTRFGVASGRAVEGLGLLDVATTRLPQRAVGEVVADPDPSLGLPALSGFENHGGWSVLGPRARPLGTARVGVGNGPAPDARGGPNGEGAVQGRVVSTYLHGPVLARNPAFADWVLGRTLGRDLEPIDDAVTAALHDERVARAPAERRNAQRVAR